MSKSEKSKRYRDTFSAILNFVEDLIEVYPPKKNTSFDLYNRIITQIKATDTVNIQKCISGFDLFKIAYQSNIVNNSLSTIPNDTRLIYGTNEKIFIPIGKYISKSDETILNSIRHHLLTIFQTVSPQDDMSRALAEIQKSTNPIDHIFNNIDQTTKEGQVISNLMSKIQQSTSRMQGVDISNPGAALQQLMCSGLLPDIMATFSELSENKDGADPQKMMKLIYQGLGSAFDLNSPISPPVTDSSTFCTTLASVNQPSTDQPLNQCSVIELEQLVDPPKILSESKNSKRKRRQKELDNILPEQPVD